MSLWNRVARYIVVIGANQVFKHAAGRARRRQYSILKEAEHVAGVVRTCHDGRIIGWNRPTSA